MNDLGVYRLHGLRLSYFTGKLESYLRVKGVPYRFIEMDMADFRRCARATGVAQMPQLEGPDGVWLTDTTAIIDHLEQVAAGPRLEPAAPDARFLSRLLEDAFDEWLWRPALYYRWAFEEDARLMGRQIARTLLRDAPGPLFLRAALIRARQRRVYLRKDGVTAATAPAVEALFLAVVDLLEDILARRPFLFGARPCAADFGLMGPVWRHFSSDPTPAALLRERAPRLLAWAARLWALTPSDVEDAALLQDAPSDLDPLLDLVAHDYLPYLAANAAAARDGEKRVRFQSFDARFEIPVSPYRAQCLAALVDRRGALSATDRSRVDGRLGRGGAVLDAAPAWARAPKVPGRIADRHLVTR